MDELNQLMAELTQSISTLNLFGRSVTGCGGEFVLRVQFERLRFFTR